MTLSPDEARRLAAQLFAAAPADVVDVIASSQPIEDDDLAPRIPEQVGDYRILRLIAFGGMGEVYEAVQEQPHRRVAVKVLRPGIVSRDALKRFRYEAEILGQLQHPNISQVFAAGTHEMIDPSTGQSGGSVPYYVMELIPGARPITKYADDETLDIRGRLELFATVCEAVHYGHQKGFIHRDLKPGNILVGSEACDLRSEAGDDPHAVAESNSSLTSQASSRIVKVIDFGVARATNSDLAMTTMQTDVGQIIGTIQYMSPEQCEGDGRKVDVRSDVYSLGVVLYELLCGKLPYYLCDSSIPGAARIIQEREPIRPSAIHRKLRGDIETVVLKALEKEPDRRYQSASDLAADVRRLLRGEVVQARRASLWVHSMRWAAQRPKTTTALACAAMVVMTAAGIFAGSAYVNLAPDRIQVSEDKQELHLLAKSGIRLKTWTCGGHAGFLSPLYARRSDRTASDMLLVDFKRDSPAPHASSLHGYAVDASIAVPAWIHRPALEDMPPYVRSLGNNFDAHAFLIADVFPEHDGDQVICTFHHLSSLTAICVFDLRTGELLYRVWHDGVLHLYWLAGPRLIVGQGFNTEVFATGRGYPHTTFPGANHPTVLVAFKPALGHKATVCTTPYGQTADGQAGETTTMAWYRAFPDPEHFVNFALVQTPTAPPQESHQRFQVQLQFRDDARLGAIFVFDKTGQIVERKCWDGWKNHPSSPPADLLEQIEPVSLPTRKVADSKS